jgi:hypothetical protein
MEGQDHDAASIIVIVDLGNCCLKRLLPLVEARRFRVRAYADLQAV